MCVGSANIDVAASAQPETPPPPPSTNNTELQPPTTAAMTPGSMVDPQSAVVVVDQASSSCPIGTPLTSASVVPTEVVPPELVVFKDASVPSIIGRGATLPFPVLATVDELDRATRHDSAAHYDPSIAPLPPDCSDSFNGSLHTANDSFGDVTIVEADIEDTSKDRTAPGLTTDSYPDPPPDYALIGAENLPPPPPSAPDSNVDQDVFATGQPPMATSSPVPIVRYVRALDTLFEELRIG